MTTTAPPQRIAKITGTFAVPGISKNRRLYSKQHIADAVAEAQQAIESGDGPVVAMLTHHGARDPKAGDVTRTAGRVTKVGLNDQGHGTFEADIADTEAGRDVAALTLPDQPYLKGVSMASVWKSDPRTVEASDGSGPVETADGFSLRGIDFTHNPGVTGAEIHSADAAESADASLICESLEEVSLVTEPINEAKGDPTPNATAYADPGYQKDGKNRYPLDTAKHVRAAWSFINQSTNAGKYTAAQVKRIKGKIKSAAKKFDITITEDLATFGNEILEAYAAMSMDNGPGSVSVSAYGVEGGDLAKAGQIVAMAALAAIAQLDPDMDGDLDLDRFDLDEDDNQMDGTACAACGADVGNGSNYCPECGAPISVTETDSGTDQKGAPMGTDTKTGETTESALPKTKDELDSAIQAGVKAALEAAGIKQPVEETDEQKTAREANEAAVAAARKLIAETDGTTETPTPANESAGETLTAEQVKAIVAEASAEAAKTATEAALDAARKEIREAGPRRRGLVPKDILEQSPEELYGEKPLKDLSTGDLEKTAEAVLFPLVGSYA